MPVLSVKELRTLAANLTQDAFGDQLGPFVLIQRPEARGPNQLPPARTTIVKADQVSSGALSLLFQFDELVVATLPPLEGVEALSVGRQADNDLVLDDPSVSKRHAILRWDALTSRCTVQDTASTNGTFLNASIRLDAETTLKNGDIVSFGELQYWFLLTPTLYEKLRTAPTRSFV